MIDTNYNNFTRCTLTLCQWHCFASNAKATESLLSSAPLFRAGESGADRHLPSTVSNIYITPFACDLPARNFDRPLSKFESHLRSRSGLHLRPCSQFHSPQFGPSGGGSQLPRERFAARYADSNMLQHVPVLHYIWLALYRMNLAASTSFSLSSSEKFSYCLSLSSSEIISLVATERTTISGTD